MDSRAIQGAQTALDSRNGGMDLVERVITAGDLSKLSPAERLGYYKAMCDSLGLNPLTRPFEYIVLNGKMVLYARRDATDQLRKVHNVSITIVSREVVEDVYVVTARATLPDGRTDESIGAVSIKGLSGEARANALMKGETKAKRRVTLSIVGLGLLDETETSTIPDARPVEVDGDTGEIVRSAEDDDAAADARDDMEPHWAQRAEVLARFWPWTERLGLAAEEVHEALGVEHLQDYEGSMVEAKAALERWVAANSAPEETEEQQDKVA